jgi:predicted dienelactone hydrolase
MRTSIALALLLTLPAAVHAAAPVQVCEATWADPARAGRAVPIRIRMPAGTGKVPLVLFSHGLGGNLDSGTDWAAAWADAGIAVINIEHAGSDRAVLSDGGVNALMRAMNAQQLQARAADVSFVLDAVPKHPREGACDLGRIAMNRIGMSGHSFGAITTHAVSGQHYPVARFNRMTDPRIKASIAFSPSPAAFNDDKDAFGAIRIPFLSITGSEDNAPVQRQVTAADRQRPYRAMPPGGKYLLVLDGATHMQFNGQDNLRAGTRPDPHVRAVTIAATTAFWRAYLMDDGKAAAWLSAPDGLRATLSGKDRFESK